MNLEFYFVIKNMKENSLTTLYSLPPGDTQSTSVVYIKGMLGGGGEEKGTMMTLEHTDELQEIWYPCMYVLPQDYKL